MKKEHARIPTVPTQEPSIQVSRVRGSAPHGLGLSLEQSIERSWMESNGLKQEALVFQDSGSDMP